MPTHRYLLLLLVLLLATLSSACSTITKPTRPSDPLQPIGEVSRFRFDGEYVQLREPGMPLANSRAWQREVQNYTASTLNEMLRTPETAPPVQTIVVFDLASPSAIQIGTWKEMTIELTTMLPSGRVVKSEPVTENIDDPIEYFLLHGLMFSGSILDVGVAIGTLFLFIGAPVLGISLNPGLACGCLIGGLVVGLLLNAGQTLAAYLISGSEETRWSNLYQRALTQHARDIQAALAAGPSLAPAAPSPRPAPGSAAPAPPSSPSTAPSEPEPPAPPGAEPPPPPILDPADASPGAVPPGGTAF